MNCVKPLQHFSMIYFNMSWKSKLVDIFHSYEIRPLVIGFNLVPNHTREEEEKKTQSFEYAFDTEYK